MAVRINRVGTLVVVAVLALAGCGSVSRRTTADTASGSAGSTTPDPALIQPDAPPDPLTLRRAGATALAGVPGATLTFIESQTDDAGTWKVRVVTGGGDEQQLKIGADGVTVLVGPTAVPDNDAADGAARMARVRAAHLDYLAAVDAMLAAVTSGSITRLSLTDRTATAAADAPVWQAIVWDIYLVAHEVTVDAVSGELVTDKQV